MTNVDLTQIAYVLEWDTAHLKDELYDASLIEFPNWEETTSLVWGYESHLPQHVYLEANLKTLLRVDYPYNNVEWPIVSHKLLHVLNSLSEQPYKTFPVTMIDDTVSSKKRVKADGTYLDEVQNHAFEALLVPYQNYFDSKKSVYTAADYNPSVIESVETLVLKPPKAGFPPVFRVKGLFSTNFISGAARAACEAAEVQGLNFLELSTFSL